MFNKGGVHLQASGLVVSSAQVAPESELVQSFEDILVAPITEPSADMDTLSQTPASDRAWIGWQQKRHTQTRPWIYMEGLDPHMEGSGVSNS